MADIMQMYERLKSEVQSVLSFSGDEESLRKKKQEVLKFALYEFAPHFVFANMLVKDCDNEKMSTLLFENYSTKENISALSKVLFLKEKDFESFWEWVDTMYDNAMVLYTKYVNGFNSVVNGTVHNSLFNYDWDENMKMWVETTPDGKRLLVCGFEPT